MTWNPDKLRTMLVSSKRWNSRIALRHSKTRLRCPAGHGLQAVEDYQPLARTVTLSCRCHRGLELELSESDRLELIAFLASDDGRITVQQNPRIGEWLQKEAA
jgi:hypothetical protein